MTHDTAKLKEISTQFNIWRANDSSATVRMDDYD